MNTQSALSILTIVFGVLSLLSLLMLHFVSPEFQPSWRMVSEYALGKHHWLITSFFVCWCLSSLTLSFLLWPNVSGVWATLGVLLLMLSGIGELMGGLFDVKHPLHGLSFMLGVPSLPIAALLIGYHLINKESNTTILIASHAPWISLILMAVAMMVMMSGFKNAGIPMGPDATPPDHVPDGVIALAGYANRLLIITYIGWLLVIANNFKNIKL